jgi:hypothetical protein
MAKECRICGRDTSHTWFRPGQKTCKPCSNTLGKIRARRVRTTCDCGQVKDLGQGSCPACMDLDGQTKAQGAVISMLRLYPGGCARTELARVLVEDSGQSDRTTYRALASLLASGRVSRREQSVEVRLGSPVVYVRVDGYRGMCSKHTHVEAVYTLISR